MVSEHGADVIALFDPAEILERSRTGQPGTAERGLMAAVAAAARAGRLGEEDQGLIGSALVGARALDDADRFAGTKGGGPYAVAALLTPYRETLQALRLPAAVLPDETPPPPGESQSSTPGWLSEHFGTPE